MHPDQWTGLPQLKPRVGAHPDKWPSCLGAQTQKRPCGHAPRSALWTQKPETRTGCTHLKPQVGAHPDQRLAAPHTAQSWGSAMQPHKWPGCLLRTTPKSTGSEQLPPSHCSQSPAGPTRSLRGRQNAQQRGAAGLGEIPVPGKT